MEKSIPFLSDKEVLALLPEPYERSNSLSLEELDSSSVKPKARKRFYRLIVDDKRSLHLTCGFYLGETYERTKAFHQQLPEFTCEPFFISEGKELSLLGQEFFEGKPIDESLRSGRISEQEVTEILEKLRIALKSLETDSSEAAMHSELNDFGNLLMQNKFLGEFDKSLIKEFFLPYLHRKSESLLPKIRWSSGDLAARNIILSEDGNFRIIDCEFARQTHFFDEDWFRLGKYSMPPFSSLSFFEKRLNQSMDFLATYFWLRQALLESDIHAEASLCDSLRHDLAIDLSNAYLSVSSSESFLENNSLLLNGISKQFDDHAKWRKALERKHFVECRRRLDTESEKLKLNSRLNRIEESASWRKTAPFRLLRRKFIDPKRKLEEEETKATNKKGLGPTKIFRKWISKHDRFGSVNYKKAKKELEALNHKPLFSILLPVFDPEENHLRATIDSVFSQIYTNWELCIVNDASKDSYVKPFLDSLASKDERVKVSHRETNGHISQASNDAAGMAEGDFLVLLDHDDLLRPHSLLRNAQKINEDRKLRLIYSDEDKLDEEGGRFDHYFKPDWNPDLFLSQNYLCHLTCISREIFVSVGGFRTGVEGSQDWDLLLRITELLKDDQIGHIQEILYHWRVTEKSTAKALKAKTYALDSSLRVANEALKRRNENALAKISDPKNGYLRIKYHTPEQPPLVSIIIPTKNRLDLIARCIESILDKTSYGNYEIIVLDHESSDPLVIEYFKRLLPEDRVRFIEVNGEFNYSKINNLGADQAKGEILLFLNNDIEVVDGEWLTEMVSQTIRPDIGCVGAKLLYPNDKVQHGGVIMGLGGVAGHSHKHFHCEDPGYKHRLKLVQNYSAVTAACLSIEKRVFQKVKGFNEKTLKVAFNDVDLCLKVKQLGYRNLWTPYSVLIHHESASRGRDDSPEKAVRFHREILYLKKKWQSIMENDPCYNSNLTLKRENFGLRQKKKERFLVTGKTKPRNFLDCRRKLYDRLSGQGIEIGAFEHPAELGKNCSVAYCDAITTAQARKIFPEINHAELKEVDYVIDLDKTGLESFGDESKDFIIINHVLEHLFFPDFAITECHRVLKSKGFLILAIPDKFHTFDLEHSITSSKSILKRKERTIKVPTPEDYFPVLENNHPEMLKEDAKDQKEFLKKLMKRREHLNIWDTIEFKSFFNEVCSLNELNFNKIKEFTPNTNNFEYACLYEKA